MGRERADVAVTIYFDLTPLPVRQVTGRPQAQAHGGGKMRNTIATLRVIDDRGIYHLADPFNGPRSRPAFGVRRGQNHQPIAFGTVNDQPAAATVLGHAEVQQIFRAP